MALARALVLNPSVLLLDEPLGALDAKLRKDLQVELRTLQQAVGITFLYVTHDQEEALTMSDRLAVHERRPGGAGRSAGAGVLRTGDGVRRRVPRLGQRARRQVLAADGDAVSCSLGALRIRLRR